MKQKTQKILFLSIYTVLFSGFIFLGKVLFFPNYLYEEKYVEPVLSAHYHEFSDHSHEHDFIEKDFSSFTWVTQTQLDSTIKKLIYEEYSKKYSVREQDKVRFRFIPGSLEESIKYSYVPIAEIFLYNRKILSKIEEMWLLLYKSEWNTRWRMKNGNIHMYNPESMTDSEFLAVLLHEFGHYYDIYSLRGNAFGDVSQKFYDISWKSVTTIKPGLTSEDFVSWYSMTNQYEDFAETYLYYIMHNEDFAFRSLSNPSLQKKYDFMRTYINVGNDFTLSSYGTQDVQKYYWDVTKIPVDVKKFLQYMQEDI